MLGAKGNCQLQTIEIHVVTGLMHLSWTFNGFSGFCGAGGPAKTTRCVPMTIQADLILVIFIGLPAPFNLGM
jgi:hypothetical protein